MSPTSIIIVCVLVLLVAAVIIASRRQEKDEFDERQLRVRADAFRIGFLSMLGSVIAMMVLFSWKLWMERVDTILTLIGTVTIAFLVFAVYCITHDAFFRRKEKPQSYLILCIIVVLLNLSVVIRYLKNKGTLLIDGKATMTPFGNTIMGGAFIVIAIVLVIKILVNRKEEEDDEES